MSKKVFYIYGSLSAAGFALDRLLKQTALVDPSWQDGFFIIPGWLGFWTKLNSGFAFSWPISNSFSAILSATVAMFAVFWFIRTRQSAVLMVLAGGLSNFIDRLFYGAVVDYLYIPFGAVINLADIMVVVGAVLLLINREKNVD